MGLTKKRRAACRVLKDVSSNVRAAWGLSAYSNLLLAMEDVMGALAEIWVKYKLYSTLSCSV